ncbi:MAG TPA: Ku protein [Acidobacteriaceae bacterium]|nr:Ku protein [Acidobacteriaceae bacterium]
MPRPFWAGQVQISLVSFGIQLFPATEPASEIRFHQVNRKTGERIHHQNVSSADGDEEAIEKKDIVKGYEYAKDEYVLIEPEEIENLRVPSKKLFQVAQFVRRDEIPPEFFEKPYFVVPEKPEHAEAFAVVRKAMQSSNKVAIGKIAFSGREHILALAAPEKNEDAGKEPGMMAYILRYVAELRKPAAYFSEIKMQGIDKDELALAEELIQRKSSPFKPEQYTDDYEAALRALIDAKIKHAPIPKGPAQPKSPKVVNLMDALRRSVQSDETDEKPREAATAKAGRKPVKSPARSGLTLVSGKKKPTTRAAKSAGKRKSA